jgi:hypothetical protein
MPFASGLDFMMNSLLKGLLAALDSDEREIVSGDLLEAQESPSASVFQVLSLIIRRQLVHWARWQCWLVFTTVIIPLAVVLSQTAKDFAGWSAVYSWMLINNTDAALLRDPGFWYGARESSGAIGKFAFVLFCCSWACGRLIAQLSRNARLSMGLLFAVTSFFMNIVGLPSHARASLLHTNDKYFPNGAVFAHLFYRDWFPAIVYAITVLIPFFLGIVQTEPSVRKSKALRILFSCSTTLVLVGLIEQRWLLMELWSWQIIPVRLVHLPNLLPVASICPACFLLIELGKRWSTRGFHARPLKITR